MVFIRKKKIAGNTYYYLVENYREGKKVRQRVVAYLGGIDSVLIKLKGRKK